MDGAPEDHDHDPVRRRIVFLVLLLLLGTAGVISGIAQRRTVPSEFEGQNHVEEIDDMMSGMRDDSSSSDSISDNEAQLYRIEVEAPNDELADTVRGSAEAIAHELDAGIEFTDEF